MYEYVNETSFYSHVNHPYRLTQLISRAAFCVGGISLVMYRVFVIFNNVSFHTTSLSDRRGVLATYQSDLFV